MSQISSLLLIILTFLTIQSLPEDNIVIGIFTQKYFYGDHMPVDGSVLTYLSPTYVNLASMTGAKVVPIYSYTSKTEILAQLEKVNGVIFTGGE
jgi:gamma-glutamyl-gamma-aminobutyrate hydrolase PuuD